MRVTIDGWAWLPQAEMTFRQNMALRKHLTVVPRQTFPDGDPPPPLRLYEETETHLGIPRAFFLRNQRRNNDLVYKLSQGHSWPGDVTFTGKLRPGQQQLMKAVLPKLQEKHLGGMLVAPTGMGKTVCAAYLMAVLQVPTLIVLHREALIDEWAKTFDNFLPDARWGRIQGPNLDYRGFHASIAMVQTLTSKGFDPPVDFYDWPGLVIFDEAHRVSAATWSKVPPRFPSRWRVGLTATPRRKDGAEDVFFWHLGEILYRARKLEMKPLIKRVWTTFDIPSSRSINPALVRESTILRYMMLNQQRNLLIVNKLLEAYRKGRRILLLSKRLKHLDLLMDLFRREWDVLYPDEPQPKLGKCVGAISKEERQEIKADAEIIFATAQYVSEGFDVPTLDTLFMAMPLGDIEQPVGRILRKADKKQPIVVDFRDDNIEKFRRRGERRDRQYDRLYG